jgi:outer membrane protein assembly factor BamB
MAGPRTTKAALGGRLLRQPAFRLASTAMACLLLSGCASDGDFQLPKMSQLNPFATPEARLPGDRVAVLTQDATLATQLETGSLPVSLPGPVTNSDWPTAGGNTNNAPGHLAFGGELRSVWSTDVGTGSSSQNKLTSRPIAVGGRLFAMDAAGIVTAMSAAGGGKAWTANLAPEGEESGRAYGGGITSDGGTIYASTGYGTAVALDMQTGAKRWEKQLGAPSRIAPVAAEGRLYVLTIEGRVLALSVSDGSELWSYRGTPQQGASLLNASSPAILGNTLVVPFSAGEVVALDAGTGQPKWSEVLSQGRASSALASLTDPASPVIDGGVVYAASNGGRLIATNEGTGERIWSLPVSSAKTPWVAGDAIYVTDPNGQLIAAARDGSGIRWATKLPGESKLWTGPVMAGGRLWVASAKGKVVGVDALTGAVATQKDIGTGVFITPIVVAGRLYVLDDAARLIAFE